MACMAKSGTSPRMRGKHLAPPRGLMRLRNIPAYAGKTTEVATASDPLGEHPRVCGENQATTTLDNENAGTSPRMRGKHRVGIYGHSRVRNIPAYAGKTDLKCEFHCDSPEHPRVCGENRPHRLRVRNPQGTSPRMRGKLGYRKRQASARRNIPAYAGKTP